MISVSRCLYLIKKVLYKLLGKPIYHQFNHETLTWINFAHASPESMPPLEKHYLFKMALEDLPSGNPILEIGVFSGRSTSSLCFIKNLLGISNKIITTDPWLVCDDQPVSETVSAKQFRDHIRQQFLNNMKLFNSSDLPFSFDLTSDSFFSAWEAGHEKQDLFGAPCKMGGPLSCVFLDGDHSLEPVRRDFSNITKFLEIGGIIYVDDSSPDHRNTGEDVNYVYMAVQEMLASGQYEVMCKNPNYLLRKIR